MVPGGNATQNASGGENAKRETQRRKSPNGKVEKEAERAGSAVLIAVSRRRWYGAESRPCKICGGA